MIERDSFGVTGLFWWCFQVLLFDHRGFFSRIRLRSRSDSIMSLNSLRADHASSACNCSNSTPRLRAILSRTASDGFLIPRSISESPGAEMLIRRESSRPEIPFPFRVCRMKAPRFVVGILLIAVRTLQEWISNMTISHIAPSNLRNCLNDLVCILSGFCCNRKFVKSDCKMPWFWLVAHGHDAGHGGWL